MFNFAKELYQYPESLRPLHEERKRGYPLEAFMKGARNTLLSLITQDNILITVNHHQKTKPQYAQERNMAKAYTILSDSR